MSGGSASPYSTGGGGVTFERLVAARYMAMMLAGRTSESELGTGRTISRVSFQQAPAHRADDLVIEAEGHDGDRLTLAAAVRRRPNIVTSDEEATKLVGSLLDELDRGDVVEGDHRIGLIVAGEQPHATQLATLASLAAGQSKAAEFHELVNEPGKFAKEVRGRLDHLQALVKANLGEDVEGDEVTERTWQLLAKLIVRQPRLEVDNPLDWDDVPNWLLLVARNESQSEAAALAKGLVTLASEYAPLASRPTTPMLRKRLHANLVPQPGRDAKGWMVLGHLQAQAIVSVRRGIGAGETVVSLPREGEQRAIAAAIDSNDAVVVHGDSGVGKSALAIGALEELDGADSGERESLILNLRHLPDLTVDFVDVLGRPFEELLQQLGAPTRTLLIDGADAAGEGHGEVFAYLVRAAQQEGIRVAAVTSSENRQIVVDSIRSILIEPIECPVAGLTDDELGALVRAFPNLARLHQNVRARELLRRPVVVDLLVRSDLDDVPLSDSDAAEQVWAQMVRRKGRAELGLPDDRETAMLLLAKDELQPQDKLELRDKLDAAAVNGLKLEGLLRASSTPGK